jgi:hypothetical protein
MPRRLAAFVLAGLALAGTGAVGAVEMKERRPLRSTELPRPLDPDVAVRSELRVARRAGTRAAYDLFIARHPDHPLARVAREEREALPRRPG